MPRLSFQRAWLASFAGFLVLAILWSLAQPPFSGQDELEHVLKAEAVVRGEWGGPAQSVPGNPSTVKTTPVNVHLPAAFGYDSKTGSHDISPIACYLTTPEVSASCARRPDAAPWLERRVAIYLGRAPVLPYLIDGAPVALSPGPFGLYGARLLTGAAAAALMATAVAFAMTRRRPLLLLGVLVSITPAALAGWGVVSSGPLEVASAALAWVMVALLASGEPRTPVTLGVTALSISVLALSRPISALWAVLVLAALVLLLTPRGVLGLVKGRAGLVCASCVGLAIAGAVAWYALDGPRFDPAWTKALPELRMDYYRNVHSFGPRISHVLGNVLYDWHQTVGAVGQTFYLSPGWVQIGWTALIGAVVACGAVMASRRLLAVLAGLTLVLFGLPVVAQVPRYAIAGLFWYGRYDLPVLSGILILSASSLDYHRQRLPELRRLLAGGVAAIMVMQLLTYFGALRRYVVGVTGDLSPFRWGHGWQPPVSALVLLGLMTVSIVFVYSGFWLVARRYFPPRAHGDLGEDPNTSLAATEA